MSLKQPIKTQQAQSTTTVVEAQQRSDIVGKKPLHIIILSGGSISNSFLPFLNNSNQ